MITRRVFATMLGATLGRGIRAQNRPQVTDRPAGSADLPTAIAGPPSAIALVLAPSNLGLRPENGRQPGTWGAPQALMEAGLADALRPVEVVRLARPRYEFDAQSGTRIRNGKSIRAFSLQLAATLRRALVSAQFPVVIGGDCSILLGSLHGLRLAGGRGLVHVDGHSDFSHPGNYNSKVVLGAAAGMDLALATGRGEALLTSWPQVGTPLAQDADVVQIGERSSGDPAFMKYYGDVFDTQITMITVQRVHAGGVAAAARQAIARLAERELRRAWLHVDLDVLDQAVMPAVDSTGTPGFDYAQLATLVAMLRASGRIAGINFSIYDPERDPDRRYARELVRCIAESLSRKEAA